MSKNVFRKLTPNRGRITMKLLDNPVIVRLLHNMKDNVPIAEMDVPEDLFDLYGKRIFKRTNIDGIAEEEACYIMFDFPFVKPNPIANNEYMDSVMTFTIMCHKNVANVLEGDRIDIIASELFDMFNGSREFGFRIGTPTMQAEYHRNYYIVRMIFEITDFA